MEFGGTIGVFFFLAQAISVAMYVVGFTEAFFNTFPGVPWTFVTVASTVNLITFICVTIGAGWTIKVQYAILALLVLSLISFFVGAVPDASWAVFHGNISAAYPRGESFFTAFALFFPAVTGIMAGANMSGDLRDPGRSIPTGTIGAIFFTGTVYLVMALLLSASRPQAYLIANPFSVKEIAWSPLLITAGVFAATLSSALGSISAGRRSEPVGGCYGRRRLRAGPEGPAQTRGRTVPSQELAPDHPGFERRCLAPVPHRRVRLLAGGGGVES